MTEYAAIPTVYRGIQMRSRLEAKWACVFDQLKWRWEYEPIDLNGWIPDFVLSLRGIKKPVLVEIKPVFNFYADRPIVIKVEQALGAPKPAELRLPHEDYSSESWDVFFENLQYEVLYLGAAPRSGVHGEWIIGWRLDQHFGWGLEPENLCSSADLDRAWRVACNATQWKAPR
jgi:hypothetical protein